MSRPQTTRAAVLFVALAWTGMLHAQATPTAAPPKPADAQPTAPAAAAPAPVPPTIEPVVITSAPEAAAASPTTTTPAPPATPPAPAPPESAPSAPAHVEPVHGSVSHRAAAPVDDAAAVHVSSPFSVMGVIDHRWNTSSSFDLFADNDVTTFYGLAIAYDFLSLTDDINLGLELGWNTGDTNREGLLGGNISRTEMLTHNANAAVTARIDLFPWLAPHARLSGGFSVIDMSLRTQLDDVTFTDHVVAPFLGLGVGASIQTPARALATRKGQLNSLRIGARFEVGYTLAGDAAFTLRAKDDLRVPVTDASTGSVSRSGPYIHTAAFVRL